MLTVADEVLAMAVALLVVAVDQVVGMLARVHRILAKVIGPCPLTIHGDLLNFCFNNRAAVRLRHCQYDLDSVRSFSTLHCSMT